MTVAIQQEDFNPGRELARLTAATTDIGAIVTFIGQCREFSHSRALTAMTLEHYPAMTLRHLERLEQEAKSRWPLKKCLIIHRYGRLLPGERIVLVLTAAAHRQEAFQACQFLIDSLKTQAPFWKKEHTAEGEYWVTPQESDTVAQRSWDIKNS